MFSKRFWRAKSTWSFIAGAIGIVASTISGGAPLTVAVLGTMVTKIAVGGFALGAVDKGQRFMEGDE